MKKLFFTLALCFATSSIFAQDDPAKLRNDGVAALDAKNYEVAYNNFSKYLETNQDSVIAFNCGICATKINKAADAIKYFDIAIDKKYNVENALLGKANVLKDMNAEKYIEVLTEAMNAFPQNKNFGRMFANYYLSQGIRAQKAGKVEDAMASFKEILKVDKSNKRALYSLGTLFYNHGANILKKATPLATTDRSKYDAEKAKADEEFKEAKGYLETLAKELSPANPKEKAMLGNVNAILKGISAILK